MILAQAHENIFVHFCIYVDGLPHFKTIGYIARLKRLRVPGKRQSNAIAQSCTAKTERY